MNTHTHDKKLLDNAIIAYYGMDDALMSDAEFDSLFEKVYGTDVEPFEIYQTIFTKNGRKRPLAKRMLSLKKARTAIEVEKWRNKVIDHNENARFFIAPKYDGLACLVDVQDGKIISATTRGDGSTGEDVTYAVSKIPVDSDFFPHDGLYQVEVCMSAESMRELNDIRDGENYTHPRNAAAGVLRTANKSIADYAKFLSLHKHFDANDELHKDGDIEEQMNDYRDSFIEEMSKTGKSILTDGIVIFACDKDGQLLTDMGDDGARPRYSIAWKFPNSAKIATISNVHWQQGRTKNTPVATFTPPVDFDGVMVSRASLHNKDIIDNLGICIGDQVEIVRSNEVIPYVKALHSKGSNRHPIPQEPEISITTQIQLAHMMNVLNVRGAGPKIISDLAEYIDENYEMEVNDFLSTHILLCLVAMAEEGEDAFIDAVESFSSKSATEFLNNLNDALDNATMVDWFAAIGVPGIGRRMFTKLMNAIGGGSNLVIEKLLDIDDLEVEGFGEERISLLREYAHEMDEMEYKILEFVNPGVEYITECPDSDSSKTENILKVVVTGKIEGMTRKDIASALQEMNCTMDDSVKADTSVLFNASGKTSSKTKSAEKHNVPIENVSSWSELQDKLNEFMQ